MFMEFIEIIKQWQIPEVHSTNVMQNTVFLEFYHGYSVPHWWCDDLLLLGHKRVIYGHKANKKMGDSTRGAQKISIADQPGHWYFIKNVYVGLQQVDENSEILTWDASVDNIRRMSKEGLLSLVRGLSDRGLVDAKSMSDQGLHGSRRKSEDISLGSMPGGSGTVKQWKGHKLCGHSARNNDGNCPICGYQVIYHVR